MIYLDYNATTPVDLNVLQTMLPYFSEKFGNAASATHLFGVQAKDAVEHARKQIAKTINCDAQEIIFTSGATEAINIAIKGIYNLYQQKGNHIVTVETEHKAVLDTCAFLEKKGAQITYLSVDKNGLIDLQELEKSITEKTILVSVMYANNETGVIQNIKEISKIVHAKNSIFLCDATQAIGKISVDIQKDGIDLMCISAHKFYGPKGIGALYFRRKNPRVSLETFLHGGGHERNIRSGTLNVPAIVGFDKACELISITTEIENLRNYFENTLQENFKNQITINGKDSKRLPNTSNITFPFKAVDFIHHTKNKLAVATGSACTSAENLPSHVLTAMGLTKDLAEKSIRFSFGKYTTKEEIIEVIKMIKSLFK
ncbi:MAG TPA: cysteine desulfurase family protein [Chitinophagales bacterium]|nr:cysteine desulfurase family protein [Chitinophagales bacterium]